MWFYTSTKIFTSNPQQHCSTFGDLNVCDCVFPWQRGNITQG